MIRKAAVLLIGMLVVLPIPTAAQTTKIKVYIDRSLLEEIDNVRVVSAIKEALSNDPFLWEGKPDDGVLLIVPADQPQFRRGQISFVVSFFRNGNHIGDSQETCLTAKPADCADQIAQDAQSAVTVQ